MKILLLLLISVCSYAQEITVSQQRLWVTTILPDTSFTNLQKVVLGSRGSGVCFSVDYIFCFHDVVRIKSNPPYRDTFTCVSEFGDKYMIYRLVRDDGFCIWIQNISKGFPHYYMGTRPPNSNITLR